MRGSEGPTSAASFHSRLPCNLNRGDIIRPSILSSTWPLGVHPTRDISAPYTAYYLDRLHLTHASRCYSKLRPLPPLSLLISPFLPLPSGGEIDFHDRATFPDTEDINNVVSWSLENVHLFLFDQRVKYSKSILSHRLSGIQDYCSNIVQFYSRLFVEKTVVNPRLRVSTCIYIYIFSRNYPSWR